MSSPTPPFQGAPGMTPQQQSQQQNPLGNIAALLRDPAQLQAFVEAARQGRVSPERMNQLRTLISQGHERQRQMGTAPAPVNPTQQQQRPPAPPTAQQATQPRPPQPAVPSPLSNANITLANAAQAARLAGPIQHTIRTLEAALARTAEQGGPQGEERAKMEHDLEEARRHNLMLGRQLLAAQAQAQAQAAAQSAAQQQTQQSGQQQAHQAVASPQVQQQQRQQAQARAMQQMTAQQAQKQTTASTPAATTTSPAMSFAQPHARSPAQTNAQIGASPLAASSPAPGSRADTHTSSPAVGAKRLPAGQAPTGARASPAPSSTAGTRPSASSPAPGPSVPAGAPPSTSAQPMPTSYTPTLNTTPPIPTTLNLSSSSTAPAPYPNSTGPRPTLNTGLGTSPLLGTPGITKPPPLGPLGGSKSGGGAGSASPAYSSWEELLGMVARQRGLSGGLEGIEGLGGDAASVSSAVGQAMQAAQQAGAGPGIGTAPVGPPPIPPEDQGKVLTKRKVQELVAEVDGKERLEGDVEDLLLEIADEFIESVTQFACRLAKHRKGNSLEVRDLQLHLERNWNIRIPFPGSYPSRPR